MPPETTSSRPGGPSEPVAPDLPVILDRLATWLRRAASTAEWNTIALSTLGDLSREGPLRVTDLVAVEHITQPGMTRLLRRFETAGFITRQSDPEDARATLVSLTPAGHAYLAEIHRGRAEVIADHLSRLSPAQQASLAAAGDALTALASLPLTPGADRP